MWNRIFPNRFKLLKAFILIFVSLSFLLRCIFLYKSIYETDNSLFTLISTFAIGLFFDIGTVSFFAIPYIIYLVVIPKKLYGTIFDRVVTHVAFALGLLIFLFSFFAEITFWMEFHRRFNFIAVDYLIYTYEVVKNINESYPIPWLLGAILTVLFILIFITHKAKAFHYTFKNQTTFKEKLLPAALIIGIAFIFAAFVNNEKAEQFENRYNNEIAKTGIYSFFAAFRNNELSYTDFYKTLSEEQVFSILKKDYKSPKVTFVNPKEKSILRTVKNSDSLKLPQRPNIILICVESLSSRFLNSFGSDLNITPTLDSLANESLFFTNIYATGTRTVRGMEAITLSIPPTPGRSIVKRENNGGLFTIGEVFREQGYERNFFYGGDGYFDNMNTYFGGNGFNIVDRGRGFLLDTSIKTKRTNIDDDEVTFENAWGVCDEDIYNKVIKEADKAQLTGTPFFNFIMTTSNHRPYTYPKGKIDIPSGTSREGGIKYTDYAIANFLKQAKTKPWYNNTLFVIMADHCASSAGRWALDVENYHIPALIFNAGIKPEKVHQFCSQIDVFPTIFDLLNWDYTTNLFGKNILDMKPEDERAFIGNYRKLGLLKSDSLMVLSDQHKSDFYKWERTDNSLKEIPENATFLNKTISYYQAADYLYRNKGLKIKK
ncbi:LTA synthase family protein [Mariniflexile sp.]|uniref:LTA synthase family protein n=1 Tax=Mariniflexile sp. TaxID=1979402 RepID=UPI0040488C76